MPGMYRFFQQKIKSMEMICTLYLHQQSIIVVGFWQRIRIFGAAAQRYDMIALEDS